MAALVTAAYFRARLRESLGPSRGQSRSKEDLSGKRNTAKKILAWSKFSSLERSLSSEQLKPGSVPQSFAKKCPRGPENTSSNNARKAVAIYVMLKDIKR